jgi:hypothetical protein
VYVHTYIIHTYTYINGDTCALSALLEAAAAFALANLALSAYLHSVTSSYIDSVTSSAFALANLALSAYEKFEVNALAYTSYTCIKAYLLV